MPSNQASVQGRRRPNLAVTDGAATDSKRKVIIARDLGELQFKVLTAVALMSPHATVPEVMKYLRRNGLEDGDVGQIYAAFKTLCGKNVSLNSRGSKKAPTEGWIKMEEDKLPSRNGGRRQMCFSITRAGEDVLEAKAAHLQHLVEFYQASKLASSPAKRD